MLKYDLEMLKPNVYHIRERSIGGQKKIHLTYDVGSGSEITQCNKIDKPLVVYKFSGNVMTSIASFEIVNWI